MSKKKNEGKSNRRAFLKNGALLGLGAVAGNTIINKVKAGESSDESKEKIKVLSADGKLIEVDRESVNKNNPSQKLTKKDYKNGIPDRKFVMVVDLSKCKNARKCVDSCQEGHYLPADHEWIRIYLLKDANYTAPYWFPRPCFHCDNPLCVSVCPVGATYKRDDGIVLIDTERCIGCKFCMTGCPYSARVFHWKEPEVEVPEEIEYSPETNVPPKEGTVGKCVFCADLLRKGELPRCVTACPMGVIYFGDLVEDVVTNGVETVRFSDLMRDKAGYRYREELGSEPSVYYLPPTNRQFPLERGFDGIDKKIIERYEKSDVFKDVQK
ncbi:4Fe-4S dicluster domain-containing protein [Bacteroidota bacterium]